MTFAGVIAEYNPLHNGHALLIRDMRRLGADAVAVVMSGNFVQRGEPAILSKWARAGQALACGADLVAELPLPWAVAGAERFALGGVSLLTALGADVIGFGSECGDLAKLQQAQAALASGELHNAMRALLSKGTTFAAARQQAVESLFGRETAALLREPNNVLGIEYLKAIERLKSGIKPVTVRRENACIHTGESGELPLTSSAVRAMMRAGTDVAEFLPEAAYRILAAEAAAGRAPADLSHLGRGPLAILRGMDRNAFACLPDISEEWQAGRAQGGKGPPVRGPLAILRGMDRNAFACLPDISEGLENRLFAAVQKAGSIPELLRLVKTKRYPMARIRRIILSALLGIRASDAAGTPPYLRVLGIGANGPGILRRAEERKLLPIVSRSAEPDRLGGRAAELFRLENRAADFYALCMPSPGPCGLDRSTKLVLL